MHASLESTALRVLPALLRTPLFVDAVGRSPLIVAQGAAARNCGAFLYVPPEGVFFAKALDYSTGCAVSFAGICEETRSLLDTLSLLQHDA